MMRGTIWGLLVGTLIGAAVGFLYSPRSGHENREMIREKAGNVYMKARDTMSQWRGKAQEEVEKTESEVGQAE
jgi:gas vesicle protein